MSFARLSFALMLLPALLRSQMRQTPQVSQTSQAGAGWAEYGGDAGGTRFARQDEITPKNVGGLTEAWTFHTHVFDTPSKSSNWRASFEATPVLWNDTLYFDSPFDTIFAVDAATGKQRWTFDPKVDREGGIYIVTSRGVSLWHAKRPQAGVCGSDRVFVATLDRRLMARDAKTGAACSGFGDAGTVDLTKGVEIAKPTLYGFTSAPTIVGDLVILGSSVGDNQFAFTASGAVRGFSAITGQQMWSWEPLPWAMQQRPRQAGSGNAWSTLTGDAEHDLVFVPTGSASVDFYGGLRPGDNRDADSIVALRASTGQKVWGFQMVHHDLWDYDTPSQPVLFTFRDGTPAVAVTTKTNMIYVFNRLTGAPLYPVEERPVPASNLPGETAWPTQPFSSLPPLMPLRYSASDLHFHDAADQTYCQEKLATLRYEGLFTPPSRQGSLLYPGSLGGSNWGSSAFDPRTGVLYTRVSSFPFVAQEVENSNGNWPDTKFAQKLHKHWRRHAPEWLGGDPPTIDEIYPSPDSGGDERDESLQGGTPYRLARSGLMSPHGLPCGPEPFGALVATNLNTGRQEWTVAHGVMVAGEAGSIGAGGPAATAGGLIFVGSSNDGYLRGYAAATGAEVWRQRLPVASNATPMSYASHGRQYVVIAAGGHGFIGKGQDDQVIAFALPAAEHGTKEQPHGRVKRSGAR